MTPGFGFIERRPTRKNYGAFPRSPIRWIMRDDVTGLHIPMGSNPGTELNNLFVMNINSEETDSYCRETEAEVQVETRSTIKGEGKKGLLTTNPSVPFTSYDVHPTCTVSPLSVSLSLFLSFSLSPSSTS